MVQREFEGVIREIAQLGFGEIFVAHSKEKEEEISEGVFKTSANPDLPKRCLSTVNKFVDLIGWVAVEWDENEQAHRYLYTRSTPTILAGSRWKYLPPKIDLNYDSLVNAINEAINKQEMIDGAKVVNEKNITQYESLDFDAIRERANTLWTELFSTGTEEEKVDLNEKIMLYVEQTLGKPKKLSEITRQEVEGFYLIEQYLEELVHSQENKNGN